MANATISSTLSISTTLLAEIDINNRNPNKLTWSQTRSILKHGTDTTKTSLHTAMASSNERADSYLNCSICLEPYHSTNVEGQIEKPALAACGHIFGDVCMERWLARPMKHVTPSCPICRFPLQFTKCLHAIAAVDPYDIAVAAPAALKADKTDIPASCSTCSIRGLPIKSRYESLQMSKAELNLMVAEIEVTISLIQEREDPRDKTVLENRTKEKARYVEALQEYEKSLVGMEDTVKHEMDGFIQGLKEKPVWHQKVDSDKWAVPEGERAAGDEWGDNEYGEDDEYGSGPDEDEDEEDQVDMDDREGGSLHSGGESVDRMSGHGSADGVNGLVLVESPGLGDGDSGEVNHEGTDSMVTLAALPGFGGRGLY